MNNIASGEWRNGDNYFQPQKLLTRAHFSAFLARALTLRKGSASDFMPNQSYTYTYATKNNYYTAKYEGRNNYEFGDGRIWSYYSKSNGSYFGSIGYGSNYKGGSRYLALYSHEFLPYLISHMSIPFSLGLKFDYGKDHLMHSVPGPASNRILDTKKTIKIAGNTYSNVIEVEETYFKIDSSKRFSRKIYIAQSYGVLGIKNEKDQWEFWLHSRTKK